jgi:hypothetical protein
MQMNGDGNKAQAGAELWDEAMERRLSVRELADLAKQRGIPLRDVIPA